MFNSFKYMFQDKNFWKKFLVLFGVILCSNILINWSGTFSPVLNNGKTSVWYYLLFILGFVIMFIPYGYSISLLKSKLQDSSLTELPSIEPVVNFISGLKVIISGFILLILLTIFSFVISFLNSIFSSILGAFVPIIFNVILFLTLLTVLFMGIAMCCRYVIKPSFLNFVDFVSAAKLINCDVAKYFISFLLSLLCTAVVYVIALLSVSYLTMIGYAGLVLYCILVSFLWTYQIYVFAGLFSNAVDKDKI